MIRVGAKITDAAYEAAVLGGVLAGDYVAPFAEIRSQVGEHVAVLRVFADALKMDVQYQDQSGAAATAQAVRICMSARLEQQVADALNCALLTSRIAELRYGARAVTIPPFPMTATAQDLALMSTSGRMVLESQKMDAAIEAVGGAEAGSLVGTTGKDWILDNGALAHPGKATNFGWFLPKGTASPWRGVPIYPSPGLTAMVVQQPSWAHDIAHADYSQQCVLVSRSCTVDGQPRDLLDVLVDPDLASLVSSQGPLKIVRQPGIPEPVTPPTSAAKPAGRATIAMVAAGAGIGASLAGPPGALIGAGIGWAADAVRRKLATG